MKGERRSAAASFGVARNKELRDTLHARLTDRPNGMTKAHILHQFGINPNVEDARRDVWRVSEALAHLCRFGFATFDAASGRYYAKGS